MIDSGYEVVQATKEHAEALAHNLLPIDVESLELTSGQDALSAIETSINVSKEAYAWLYQGEPFLVFGVAQPSMLSNVGVPWMVSSSVIRNHGLEFVRQARAVVKIMAEKYGVLEGHIDARYTNTVRMFKAMGFKVSPAAPFGFNRLPFHKLTLGS